MKKFFMFFNLFPGMIFCGRFHVIKQINENEDIDDEVVFISYFFFWITIFSVIFVVYLIK